MNQTFFLNDRIDKCNIWFFSKDSKIDKPLARGEKKDKYAKLGTEKVNMPHSLIPSFSKYSASTLNVRNW